LYQKHNTNLHYPKPREFYQPQINQWINTETTDNDTDRTRILTWKANLGNYQMEMKRRRTWYSWMLRRRSCWFCHFPETERDLDTSLFTNPLIVGFVSSRKVAQEKMRKCRKSRE